MIREFKNKDKAVEYASGVEHPVFWGYIRFDGGSWFVPTDDEKLQVLRACGLEEISI